MKHFRIRLNRINFVYNHNALPLDEKKSKYIYIAKNCIRTYTTTPKKKNGKIFLNGNCFLEFLVPQFSHTVFKSVK